MGKAILVVLDGLNYQVAEHALGHLQAYCMAGRGALYCLQCELPALSRPLYECILTGVKPIDSGVVHNDVVRLSTQRSIFHYARDAGLSTAAAAYHWVSELYNQRRSRLHAIVTARRRSCPSSMGISITRITTRTRTCSPMPKACVCDTTRTFCWCTR